MYFWFPLLAGLSELTFDPRPEIRYSALEVSSLGTLHSDWPFCNVSLLRLHLHEPFNKPLTHCPHPFRQWFPQWFPQRLRECEGAESHPDFCLHAPCWLLTPCAGVRVRGC